MTEYEKRLTFKVLGMLALVLVIVSLAGCATLQSSFEQPEVRLAEVVIVEAGLLQQVYGVTLEVDNPNGFPVPVEGLDYRVRLAGQQFASGATTASFTIPAGGAERIGLEVRTNLLESIGHLSRFLSDGLRDIDYELSGDIRINLPFVGAIPFSRSGTIAIAPQSQAAADAT